MITIAQIPSLNLYSRRGHKVVAVVYHMAQGTMAGLDSTCTNPRPDAPEKAVSAHYGVGKKGECHQYVSELSAAWHCGAVNKPDLSLPWYDPRNNPNLQTIGIEFEGYSGTPLTEPQIATGIELSKGIIQRHAIPVHKDYLIGHYRLDSVNRKNCPGPAFPWRIILDELEDDMDKAAIVNCRNVTNGWLEVMEKAPQAFNPEMLKQLRSVVTSLDSELAK